jgi:hypothetical protein
LRNRCATIGISQQSQRHMPMSYRSRVVTNPPNLENQFLHRWMCYSLKRPILKQTKVVATIILALNYCSICLSQFPSRDSVPLIFRYINWSTVPYSGSLN